VNVRQEVLRDRKVFQKPWTCSSYQYWQSDQIEPTVRTNLDRLHVKTEPLFFVCEKVLNVLALVALKLDNLTHLGVGDYGTIASELLLDHLENLFLVELFGQPLDCGQGLTSIALCLVSVSKYTTKYVRPAKQPLRNTWQCNKLDL
jgi:hypothetical protein